MQKIFVKTVSKDGVVGSGVMMIVRTWLCADGPDVYLHANGMYGYKDGSPVASKRDFIGIGSGLQRRMAESWWERTGKKLSAEFYDAKEQVELERSADFQLDPQIAASDLDMVMYRRRTAKGGAVSAEKTWLECGFEVRPDWWGQAVIIQFNEWIYERVDGPEQCEAQDPAAAAEANQKMIDEQFPQ